MSTTTTITVKLKKSRIGCTPTQKKILDALGLGQRKKVKTFIANPSIQGMINKVSHMVEVIIS